MRYTYFVPPPPVPDNAFTRTVARVGTVATTIALVALGTALTMLGLAALYGMVFLRP